MQVNVFLSGCCSSLFNEESCITSDWFISSGWGGSGSCSSLLNRESGTTPDWLSVHNKALDPNLLPFCDHPFNVPHKKFIRLEGWGFYFRKMAPVLILDGKSKCMKIGSDSYYTVGNKQYLCRTRSFIIVLAEITHFVKQPLFHLITPAMHYWPSGVYSFS